MRRVKAQQNNHIWFVEKVDIDLKDPKTGEGASAIPMGPSTPEIKLRDLPVGDDAIRMLLYNGKLSPSVRQQITDYVVAHKAELQAEA